MPGSNRNLYLAATVACLTATLFGYSVGFIGGVLVLLSFLVHFNLSHLPPSALASAQATTVTSWLVGTLGGVVAGMPVYTKLGRKKCLLFCAVLYTVGAALQVSGIGGIGVFDLGRFVNGFGVGAGTLVSPLYISEISTPDKRGMLMSGYQVGVQLSALIGFWGAYFANQIFPDSSPMQYQIPTSLQLVPGILLIIGTFFIPEAPRFLAEMDKPVALTESVAWLRGLSTDDMEITNEVQQIWRLLEANQRAQALRQKSFVSEVRSSRSLRRRLMVGVGLMIAQNMAGLNAINYYAPTIFFSAGFTTVPSMLFLTGLFGLTKLIAACSFMFLFVRLRGNRFWLQYGSAVCAGSMFVLAYCIWRLPTPSHSHSHPGGGGGDDDIPAFDSNNNSSGLRWEGLLSVICVYIFSFSFGVSLGPISWNVCGEIFPPSISAKCCTITTFTQWLFQIVIAGVTPRLIAKVGWGTYVFYAGFCVLSWAWCWSVVPETRGVALGREMDALFGDVKGDGGVSVHEGEAVEEAAEEVMVEVNESSALLGVGQGQTQSQYRRHRRSSVALIV